MSSAVYDMQINALDNSVTCFQFQRYITNGQ